MRINNNRVSDLPWDDEATFETEQAMADASASVLGEAYCYVGGDNVRLGLHHEVVDNQLLVNREAVYNAMGVFGRRPMAEGEELQPSPMMGIRRADRIKAMEHLQRHIETLQQH